MDLLQVVRELKRCGYSPSMTVLVRMACKWEGERGRGGDGGKGGEEGEELWQWSSKETLFNRATRGY